MYFAYLDFYANLPTSIKADLTIGGIINKKVLLRERKRHTARRVAIPISCYSGGGSLDKNFFSSLNMYQAKSGVKNFSLYLGRGRPLTKNFFPVWTCIKPNLVSKIFPFTWGGAGWPLTKFFFPVWTCIKPNLVPKIFPFTGGGGLSTKNFFPSLNTYQAKSGVKKFSLYWDRVPPPPEQTHTCENITSRRTYVRGR